MAGDFVAKMKEIEKRVGYNDLVGKDINRNVYAHYQHEGAWFKRPHGGGPFFYARPLVAGAPEYMQVIAKNLLKSGGAKSMQRGLLAFEKRSKAATGKETGRLANGHELDVIDDGAKAWHREPTMKPLREGDETPGDGRKRRRRRRFT